MFGFASTAKSVNRNVAVSTEQPKAAPVDALSAGRISMSISELEGTWAGGCVCFDSEEPAEDYQRSALTFAASDSHRSTIAYADSNCCVVRESGILQSRSSLQSAGFVSRPADSVDTSLGAVPFIDVFTQQYTIDNQPIAGFSAAMFVSENTYNIAHTDGGTLFLGAMDESSIEQRPVEIDVHRAYKKQL